MASIKDDKIIEVNVGRILPGDYVIFPGIQNINWIAHNVEKVNILYEIEMNNQVSEKIIESNYTCSSTEKNSYKWNMSNLTANVKYEYPKYRIKIIDASSDNIIAYSNYFKVSVADVEN